MFLAFDWFLFINISCPVKFGLAMKSSLLNHFIEFNSL